MDKLSKLFAGKERGERLKQLRKALELSRGELADKFKEKYGLTYGSLQAWEDAKTGALTEKGANKLVQAFKDLGIENVTVEWLMDGAGQPPLNFTRSPVKPSNPPLEIEKIKEELKIFHKLHDNAIDLVVPDDGMSPYLNRGDFVAGEKLFGEEIKNAVGYHCIVQTENEENAVLIRLLEQGEKPDLFNLICINQLTTVTNPIIENIKLISAAPIVLIRKPKVSAKTSSPLPPHSGLQFNKTGKMQAA